MNAIALINSISVKVTDILRNLFNQIKPSNEYFKYLLVKITPYSFFSQMIGALIAIASYNQRPWVLRS